MSKKDGSMAVEAERYITKCKSNGIVKIINAVTTSAAGEGLIKVASMLFELIDDILSHLEKEQPFIKYDTDIP